MNPKIKKHWAHSEIVVAISSCSPAYRTYVITAWRDPDKADTFFVNVFPVLVIRSMVVERYSKEIREADMVTDPRTRTEAEENGWQFSGMDNQEHAIINDEELGLISLEEPAFLINDEKSSIMVLTWPFDEAKDQSALDSAINDLKKSFTP